MMTGDIRSGEGNLRICVPTRRRICREVFHSSLYEAEDVLAEANDTDLIYLEADTGFQLRNKWLSRLAFRDVSERLVLANPGVRSVELKRDYDLFVAVCQSYEDLLLINGIKNWKDRCKTSICWICEVWANSIHKYRHWMNALRRFDYVLVALEGSAVALSEAIGKPCYWIPGAVDVSRFTPPQNAAPRLIDVFSMGRRHVGIHQALRSQAEKNAIFYLHDTFAAARAIAFDHREHREVLARLSQRSRYFIVAPAKMDAHGETRGQVEIGYRYFEAAAAGAVMIGQAPDSASFREMFGWKDSVIEIRPDGTDVLGVIRSLDAQPQRISEIGRKQPFAGIG